MLRTLLLLITMLTPATAATVTLQEYSDSGREYILYYGTVDEGDIERLTEIMDENPEVKMLHLNSPGGYLHMGIQLGNLIRDREMETVLAGGASCASACPILFHAGVKRYMHVNGTLGYHPARQEKFDAGRSAQDIFEEGQYIGLALGIEYAQYLKDTNYAYRFMLFFKDVLKTTEASEMFWIDVNRAKELGIATHKYK